jgi:hypothetical protein
MKIIITESQYNELNKIDDVYDGLDPFFRRRIHFINIKSDIDKGIKHRTAKVLKHDPRSLAGHMDEIISNTIWDTINFDFLGIGDDDKWAEYNKEMTYRIKMKYGKYIIEKLNKILEDEDNNN